MVFAIEHTFSAFTSTAQQTKQMMCNQKRCQSVMQKLDFCQFPIELSIAWISEKKLENR